MGLMERNTIITSHFCSNTHAKRANFRAESLAREIAVNMKQVKKNYLRPIGKINLGSFSKPEAETNFLIRASWYFVGAVFFQTTLLSLFPSRFKAKILRLFGARIGKGFVCKPRVTIKSPWLLSIGENVWIGECVWIDNLSKVEIGSNVCISQGAVIMTGNHDWSDPTFPFFAKPVTIGDGAWITAFAVVRGGEAIPGQHALQTC